MRDAHRVAVTLLDSKAEPDDAVVAPAVKRADDADEADVERERGEAVGNAGHAAF